MSPSDNVERFRAGLKEIMQVFDSLHEQALRDRTIYRSNSHEGLRRATLRTDFMKEIHAIQLPDDIESQLDAPGGPSAEQVLEPLFLVLEKYGFRKMVTN